MELFYKAKEESGLSDQQIREALAGALGARPHRKVLIIPPDYTRYHSHAGFITNVCWHMLTEQGCQADILPALGTHSPVTREQSASMFGDIPYEQLIVHHWRSDVMKLGEVPADYISEVSDGLWQEPVSVEINRLVMDPGYDLILSVGQVVPHEVVGMANHSKNLFVGVGGADMINKSHMIGALCGLEQAMGRDHAPVRRIFDYAQEHFLNNRPILYALTVTTAPAGRIRTHGLFIGDTRRTLEEAIRLSQKVNIDFVDTSIRKCVVYLDPSEFHSTWIGNKAIYRTRMALSDGGNLLILAPGITRFGEDDICDRLIHRYGYCGRLKVLEYFQKDKELQENMGAAAHLIHGSADGRFRITYAVRDISQSEIRSVGYESADYDQMIRHYDPTKLSYGWQTLPDGEEIYYIPNPALGLWIDRSRFQS